MSIKQHLLKCIDIAIRHRQKYVAVLVELPTGNHEVIVFKRDSYADKINYYDNAYNDELELKYNPEVKIINFCCADCLEQVEIDLFEDYIHE